MNKQLKISWLFYAIVISLGFGATSFALTVKNIEFVNDGDCFSKIYVDASISGLKKIADQNLVICDDDAGFTTVLLYRAIQSFAANYPVENFCNHPMKEWALMKHSLLATLAFHANKLDGFEQAKGFKLAKKIRDFITKVEVQENIKFSQLKPFEKMLSEYFGQHPKVSLIYSYSLSDIKYEAMSMKDFKITHASYDLLPKNNDFMYVGNFREMLEAFEEASKKYLGVVSFEPLEDLAELQIVGSYEQNGVTIPVRFTRNIRTQLPGLNMSSQEMSKTQAVFSLVNAMKNAIARGKKGQSQHAGNELRMRILEIESSLSDYSEFLDNLSGQKKWQQLVSLATKLADNLLGRKETRHMGGTRGGYLSASFGLEKVSYNISSGGAQSAAKAWRTIEDGGVPKLREFNIGGFLKEFDLSLSSPHCEMGQICFDSGVAYDAQQGKLLVQVSMNVNPSEEQLQRKPLNVSVLIDISGSMSLPDLNNNSRMDWAKKALMRLFKEQFRPEDFVSIHKFDDRVDTVLEPTELNEEIIKQILESEFKDLIPRGTTNLEIALGKGIDSIASKQIDLAEKQNDYQHFVILISDAQANQGETSKSGLKSIIQAAAERNIGLIAFGIGSSGGYDNGFNQDLIDVITQSRGGSYDFASSETDMDRMIDKLPKLLQPFAYNLKAMVHVDNARLFRIYGTAADEDSIPDNTVVVDVPTLILTESEKGGGAIVLEYDVAKKVAIASNHCSDDICTPVFKIIGDDDRPRDFYRGQSVKFYVVDSSQFTEGKIVKFRSDELIITIERDGKALEYHFFSGNQKHLETLRSLRPA